MSDEAPTEVRRVFGPCGPAAEPPSGALLARGVCRLLGELGLAPVTELPLPVRKGAGLRADVLGLAGNGEVWIVECKSCPADFRSDRKWPGYLDWCDRFLFAVSDAFPADLLPEDHGLILADPFAAELIRPAPARPLAPARRKSLTLHAYRAAAERLRRQLDPGASGLSAL